MRVQRARVARQLRSPWGSRAPTCTIGSRQSRNLLNSIRTNSNSGQKEPRILRLFDMLDFHRVEVLTYVAKGMQERVADRLLRRISHPVTPWSVANPDEVPSVVQDLLLQTESVYRPRKIPTFPEFFGREPEAVGKFNLRT